METIATTTGEAKPATSTVPVVLNATRHDDDNECGCERLDNGECGCISDRIARGEIPA